MKSTTFRWGWESYAPQVDGQMTRMRAARLLLAWRRSRTQGLRNFSLARSVVCGERHYQVQHRQSGERAVLVIGGAA
ncbi:MAG: hypothetical protein E6R08_10225 [Nevskiaceae bacterium]|nr:MAG: hypothetical protein E6R08_10225 [Nevskiaceae bacterium]